MIEKEEKLKAEEYSHLDSVLKDIPRFIQNHPQLTYIEFDYYTVHDLTLFSVEPDFDFASFQATINKLSQSLGAIKRVFAKPFIVLKDASEVLPVEIVQKFNQNTFSYLGNHANTVSNILNGKVRPRKLLTEIYEDDYGIYENQIFCDFVDATIQYCKRNIRTLKQLVYASQVMEFNLLERVNHMDYYLALGKLHTGYIRDFNKYYVLSKDLYKKTMLILNALKSRLHKPVYQLNLHRGKNLKLKKTNIFTMQKDYHAVYNSYKYLLSNTVVAEDIKDNIDEKNLAKNYFSYLEILTIFALGHFNFHIAPFQIIDLVKLNTAFSFKNWVIRVSNMNNEGLLLTFSKDTTYKILLVPSLVYPPDSYAVSLLDKFTADEEIICTPFEEDYTDSFASFISIENIDSFRRLQQFFLKGMIYSDTKRDECPFCKDKLTYDPKTESYYCESCRTVIKKATCPDTNKDYYYTLIDTLLMKDIDYSTFSSDDRWLYSQKIESAMYFRNITKIDHNGHVICPICHKTHHLM